MPDYTPLLDPDLVEAAQAMREMTLGYTPMTLAKLQSRRAWMAENAAPPLADVPYEVHAVARGGQAPPVTVYVVNPRPGRSGPGILHMHGGGFTASTALLGLSQVQALATELGCPIVSVDYRLAPETGWTGSLDDNYTALAWLHANAADLGIARDRIAIMGESAGGGHAALLAFVARDRGEVPICFQCLTYPMLDDRSGTSRQLAGHIGYYGWSPEANRFGWAAFLGREPGGDDVPVAAVPSRNEDLSGLPPAWIGVGGLDLFVEEGIDWALRLNRAGVPAELLVVPGAFHGFDAFMPDAQVSRRFAASRLAALRRGLGLAGPVSGT